MDGHVSHAAPFRYDFPFCVICLCAKGQIVAVVQVVWFGEMHSTIRIDFFEAEISGEKGSSCYMNWMYVISLCKYYECGLIRKV